MQKEIYSWASRLKNLLWIEILPYHKLGAMKYKGLGRQYMLKDVNPIKREDLLYLKDVGFKLQCPCKNWSSIIYDENFIFCLF